MHARTILTELVRARNTHIRLEMVHSYNHYHGFRLTDTIVLRRSGYRLTNSSQVKLVEEEAV